jgi:multicomponent Na+:H+ antiporter subunit E
MQVTHATMNSAMLKSFIVRTAAFAFLWWVLSEGAGFDWGLPVLSIGIATVSSLCLWKPGAWRFRARAFVSFAPYFLWQSVCGGADVAWRASRPSLPVQPGFLNFPLRLESEPARVFFVWMVSLLPGTAVADWNGNQATIHVLDCGNSRLESKLRDLEQRVAVLFGLQLAPMPADSPRRPL